MLGASSAGYDREGLAVWVSDRLHAVMDPEEIKSLLRPEIEKMLLELGRKQYQGDRLADRLDAGLAASFDDDRPVAKELAELAAWARRELGVETTVEELTGLGKAGARTKLVNALDAAHRPEMREMEKVLLLQMLDSAWMEHLRSMDHLRSSVGLRGYAQEDPKVVYKREGMEIFETMWQGISDRVTDLIFRMEQLDPDFLSYLGSRWQLDKARAIHDSPASEPAFAGGGDIRATQDAAIAGSQKSEVKAQPVRNVAKRVGRNDLCPCGSGKKFKACCMRKGAGADLR